MSKKTGPPPEHELAGNEINHHWDKIIDTLLELSLSDMAETYNYLAKMQWDKKVLAMIWEQVDRERNR